MCPRRGEARFFSEAGGCLLGLMPEEPYQEVTLTLAAGDCLLAYTDGLTEAMNVDGVMFGKSRLLDAATEARAGGAADDPQRFVEQVFQAMRTFCGDAPATDDLTMVAFRIAEIA